MTAYHTLLPQSAPWRRAYCYPWPFRPQQDCHGHEVESCSTQRPAHTSASPPVPDVAIGGAHGPGDYIPAADPATLAQA